MNNPSPAHPDLQFLVVDDDPLVRQTVTEYLRSFGYSRIVEAKNGEEALAKLNECAIDIVISDWEMPNVTGLQLLQAVRSQKKYQNLPFIMVTSPNSNERLKIESAGMADVNAYIIKPFRAQVLQEKINLVLAERRFEGKPGALVVDDNESVRETVSEILRKSKYRPVYTAADGEEAYSILLGNKDSIGVVISDWEMPRMLGLEFLKKVRRNPSLSKIPFIMITSQDALEGKKLQQAMEAGVDHYLLKPFTSDDLMARVELALKSVKSEVKVGHDVDGGVAALKAGKLKDAEKAFRHALALDPKNVDACLGLGKTYLSQSPKQNFDDALQIIKQAISIDPRRPEGYLELAIAFESAMSLEKAISYLKQGADHCHSDADIRFHLGRVLIRRGHRDQGIEELNRALKLNPALIEARQLLNETEEAGKPKKK